VPYPPLELAGNGPKLEFCKVFKSEQFYPAPSLMLLAKQAHDSGFCIQNRGEPELDIRARWFMSQDQWRTLYRNAVLETNFHKLIERIKTAEKAIAEQLSLDGSVSAEERRELQDSKYSLLGLRSERTELNVDSSGDE